MRTLYHFGLAAFLAATLAAIIVADGYQIYIIVLVGLTAMSPSRPSPATPTRTNTARSTTCSAHPLVDSCKSRRTTRPEVTAIAWR